MRTSYIRRKAVAYLGLVLFAILSVVLLPTAVPAFAAVDLGSFAAKVDFATNPGPTGVVLGDIDGDGKPDLAIANYGNAGNIGNTVSVLLNGSTNGNVAFNPKVD